jgi:hypothetical protein
MVPNLQSPAKASLVCVRFKKMFHEPSEPAKVGLCKLGNRVLFFRIGHSEKFGSFKIWVNNFVGVENSWLRWKLGCFETPLNMFSTST